MNISEFNKIQKYNYDEYCAYLQKKYGMPKKDYGSKDIVRTSEGLFIHHIKEDIAISLSHRELAKKSPVEYQKKENLCYCDYLEHLWLHFLIVKFPNPKANKDENQGIGGIVNFIGPELCDRFGKNLKTYKEYQDNCFNLIKEDEDTFKKMLLFLAEIIFELNDRQAKYDRINAQLILKFFEEHKNIYEPINDTAKQIRAKKEKRKNKDVKAIPKPYIIFPGATLYFITNPKYPGGQFMTGTQSEMVKELVFPDDDEGAEFEEVSVGEMFYTFCEFLKMNKTDATIQTFIEEFNDITYSQETFNIDDVVPYTAFVNKAKPEKEKFEHATRRLEDSHTLSLEEHKKAAARIGEKAGAINTFTNVSKGTKKMLQNAKSAMQLNDEKKRRLK